MRQTGAGRPRFSAFLTALSIVVVAGLAQGQVPPLPPLLPGQVEAPGPPVGQVPEPPPVGGQPQTTVPPAPPAAPAPAPPGAASLDPFAGSPLLQMFERQPDALAPPLQLRFAPAPGTQGPLAVRLFLTVEEEFTDNADQTKDNPRSEFRTRIVPGFFIGADRPLVNLRLSYAPEVFIPGNSIGDTQINQNMSVRANFWPAGKFQLNFADDFTDSDNFQDIEDPGSRNTGTNRFLQNTATAEAAYVLPQLRTALAYTNIINQQDETGFTDTRIAHIVRPYMTYTDPRFSATASFPVTRGNENSSVSIPYWRYEGEGRYVHVVTPTVRAGVTGRYQYQTPDVGRHGTLGRGRAIGAVGIGPDGTVDLEAGADVFALQDAATQVRPSLLASYTHRFAAFAVTARYEQGYINRSEDVTDTGVTFTRTAAVVAVGSFFRDLTPTLGVRYEENTYETPVVGIPVGTTDRTWSLDATIRYLIVRSLFLTLGYTGTFRFSTQPSAEFNENLVRLGLSYQYDLY